MLPGIFEGSRLSLDGVWNQAIILTVGVLHGWAGWMGWSALGGCVMLGLRLQLFGW